MAAIDTQILVVGGGSRIAAALAPLLGDAASFIRRRPGTGGPRDVLVDNYGVILPDVFRGVRCVVNCVGISRGSAVELEEINVALPRRWATAAKAAGVRHMIQISSFSVYGSARAIDHSTSPRPIGAYGQSKLKSDCELLSMADDHFYVSILRLPLIYGGGAVGKLEELLSWWERVRLFPVPIGDISRAMIGVDLCAEVIARLCRLPQTGVVFAADSQHFSYGEVSRARRRQLFRLPLPRVMTKLVERAAPRLGHSLFADSRLAEADNLAVQYGLVSRLLDDIAAI